MICGSSLLQLREHDGTERVSGNDAMNALSHLRSRPRLLLLVVMGLVAGHAILFYRLHYAGAPVAVVSGLALMVIAKHSGLLGPLYGLVGRRSRIRAARNTDNEGRRLTPND